MGEVHIARRIVSLVLFILRSLQMVRRDRCRALELGSFCSFVGRRWSKYEEHLTPLTHLSPSTLRGGRALGLIAGRVRPPNGLSRIYQGTLESLYGATFNPPFRCLAR